MTAVLLVVFDGLRPDMIVPEVTPNLVRFARIGTTMTHARSVFPSETRVCSASVTTGCHPQRHGLVANRLAHPHRFGVSVDAGDAAALAALQAELGEPLLQAPTLGQRLATSGREFAVLSSGSTGQCYVLNPDADSLGQLTLSAHGPAASSSRGRGLLETLPQAPKPPAERAAWTADVLRTRLLSAPSDVTVLWLCEPDTTSHYGGLNSPAQQTALRIADAAFGRILDDWEAGPQRERLQIMVASDHGHAAITGHVDVAAAFAEVPEFDGCLLLPGSSAGVVVRDGDPARVARLAAWIVRQDWCGSVFAASGVDLPPGVLPRAASLIEHPRAAHLLFTLRTNDAMSKAGLPGTTLHDGALAVGGGTHGGLSRAEMRTVLMLAGSRIRAGAISELPAGLPDIAPTILALLGLPGAEDMDGRVLHETFEDGVAPDAAPLPETWEAAGPGYAQVLARVRLGRHVWLDAAQRHPI
jgi:arylsulfatase A-like enzyme